MTRNVVISTLLTWQYFNMMRYAVDYTSFHTIIYRFIVFMLGNHQMIGHIQLFIYFYSADFDNVSS